MVQAESATLNLNDTSTPFRLGIRAHDLGRYSADELARRVRAEGLDHVQLALGKAIDGVDQTLSPSL